MAQLTKGQTFAGAETVTATKLNNLVDNATIANIVDADISASAEIAVSKLADGTARQLLQTDSAGTGVEWASNIDVPGTLDVTGAAVLDSTLTVAGATTLNGSLTMGDADDIAVGTTTGTKIGTATSQKLGFFNKTPVIQPAGANQAALTNSTGGTADGTLSAVSGTGDDADINNNFTELHTLLNEIRTALVNLGLIKGAA